ncbi:hypothetical protein O181_061261 [Austropuccinia psidii MF-1]|uniref:Large ribosomal subunit protein uL15/eL18 domain-containing protein n=1 Tax=Austropuccinia psidii MF-1 TaxID=1389203 RepID=A0A9Q3HXC1_9BASI|nr:hypothetical protein [Austropuccinia psidii MF-1]
MPCSENNVQLTHYTHMLVVWAAEARSSAAAMASLFRLLGRSGLNNLVPFLQKTKTSAGIDVYTLQKESRLDLLKRSASGLSGLKPAKGSTHSRKRVGRGQGSGYGGTAGRGHKGQNANKGNSPRLGFQGGQTPITRLFPKRGAFNPTQVEMSPLNLSQLQLWIDQKRIDPTKPITMKELLDSRAVHGIKDGVKLLGKGASDFRTPNVTIVVSRASQSAIKAIEDLHGTVVCKFYNRLTLRALLKPHRFAAKNRFLPADAHPIRKQDWVRYADWENRRGYLGNPTLASQVMAQVKQCRAELGWVNREDIAAEVRARATQNRHSANATN